MTTRNLNWDIGLQILKRLPFLYNGPKISVIIPQNEWDKIKEHLKNTLVDNHSQNGLKQRFPQPSSKN
jgi:hypothetical protein